LAKYSLTVLRREKNPGKILIEQTEVMPPPPGSVAEPTGRLNGSLRLDNRPCLNQGPQQFPQQLLLVLARAGRTPVSSTSLAVC